MRVIMTKTMPGAEDGIHIQRYEAGQEYDLGESLAQSFVGSHCARPVLDAAEKQDGATKKAKGPKENK